MNEFLIYRLSMIFQLAFLLLFLPLTKRQGSSLNLDVPAEFEQAKDFGFATMLSNLLENAFIAVCKVPDSKERKVSVSLQMSAWHSTARSLP